MAGPAGTGPLLGPLHLTALLVLLTPLLAGGAHHSAPNNVAKRAADIVIVLDGGGPGRAYPARGLDAPCTSHANCTPFFAICRSDTRRCDCEGSHKRRGSFCMYMGGSPDSIAIYQVTLVLAAVFMVLVFSVFVGCVVKRTCERSRDLAERMRELSMDVYTVPAEFEGLERPPSYTDIVKIDHMVYGVPPPEYSTLSATPESQEEPSAPPLPPPRTQTLSSVVRQAASRRRAPPPPVPVHAPNARPCEAEPSATDGGGESTT